jgi:hypothetical protein
MVVVLGIVTVEEIIDYSNRMRWNLPLNATFVHYITTSILIFMIDLWGSMGKQVVSLKSSFANNVNLVNYNHM